MYCTQEQMIERFGEEAVRQLTDRGNLGAVDGAVLAAAVADASAEIDMHLAGRYVLPLSTVPLPVTRLACLLARDILAVGSDISDERWSKQAEEARKLLREIASGKVNLGVDALAQAPQGENGAQMVADPRRWDRDDSRGFI